MKSLKAIMALSAAALALLVSCTLPGPSNTTLQNDNYSGVGAVFSGGFLSGEGTAVVLGSVSGDVKLDEITLLFGGSATDQTVTVAIYTDSGTSNPGALQYSGDFLLTPSDTMLQTINLSSQDIALASGSSFRVAVFYQHDSTPSIGYDGDGLTSLKNLVYTAGSWAFSENYSIAGDWIIRATVSPM